LRDFEDSEPGAGGAMFILVLEAGILPDASAANLPFSNCLAETIL